MKLVTEQAKDALCREVAAQSENPGHVSQTTVMASWLAVRTFDGAVQTMVSS